MVSTFGSIGLSALAFSGTKVIDFLQGMITSDILKLSKSQALPALFCQYQGKIFAAGFFYYLNADCVWFITRSDRIEQTQQILKRYAALSRVNLSIVDLDVSGSILQDSSTDYHPYQIFSDTDRVSIAISARCRISWPIDTPSSSTQHVEPHDENAWLSAMISDGIPVFTPGILDQFTPNQLGLVPSDWVSLKKGCYCGQEIIARSHHLGKHQRGLMVLQSDLAPQLIPGAVLRPEASSVKLIVLVTTALDTQQVMLVSAPISWQADIVSLDSVPIVFPDQQARNAIVSRLLNGHDTLVKH